MNQLEDAAINYREAINISTLLNNKSREGMRRNNLGNILTKLGRFEEARQELLLSIECKKGFGHAAMAWTNWGLLHDLERVDPNGDKMVAEDARLRARDLYLSYRREGGDSFSPQLDLCRSVERDIRRGQNDEAIEAISRLEEQPSKFLTALSAITCGSRDLTLADDPELDYQCSVELQLLIERLSESE